MWRWCWHDCVCVIIEGKESAGEPCQPTRVMKNAWRLWCQFAAAKEHRRGFFFRSARCLHPHFHQPATAFWKDTANFINLAVLIANCTLLPKPVHLLIVNFSMGISFSTLYFFSVSLRGWHYKNTPFFWHIVTRT